AGQADIARQIEAPEEKHLAKAGINIHAAPTSGGNNGLAFRFRHSLLQDIRVRQAIIAGVDREKILRTLFSDSYPLATSTLARTAQGYEEQKDAYEFNPDKARTLLDEAGWTVGRDGIRTKDGKRLRLVVHDAPQQPRTGRLSRCCSNNCVPSASTRSCTPATSPHKRQPKRTKTRFSSTSRWWAAPTTTSLRASTTPTTATRC